MPARADLLDLIVVFVAGLGIGLLVAMYLDEVERKEAEVPT